MNRPLVMALFAVAGVALIVGAAAGQTLSNKDDNDHSNHDSAIGSPL